MNFPNNQTELDKLNNTSSTTLNNERIIINIDEEVDKIEKLIEENKKKGNKTPLYAIIFLLFYKAEKNTLNNKELYSLLEKEIINNKDNIITFNGNNYNDYNIINQNNFRKRIYDIIKKKKWLIKNVKDSNIIEYTLKLDKVLSIINKIIHYLKFVREINH